MKRSALRTSDRQAIRRLVAPLHEAAQARRAARRRLRQLEHDVLLVYRLPTREQVYS